MLKKLKTFLRTVLLRGGRTDCRTKVWVEVASGRLMYPFSPKPHMITLWDVAHHLSIIPRYNGATRRPYSVAEHCVLLADYGIRRGLSPLKCLNLLLHDGAEAYLTDVMSPIKDSFRAFRAVEDRLLRMIHGTLGVPYLEDRSLITLLDKSIILDERAAMLPNHKPENHWHVEEAFEPLGVEVRGLPWDEAEGEFLLCFQELMDAYRGECT
jgi:hypothetical protein